jgi:hypothetical protein
VKVLKGQVTIFISMVMMCIFALLCGLLESARTAGARWYLQTSAASAMDSVFSQYHRQLWDSYRLLFVEYEREEELEADFSGFIKPYLEKEGWYPMEIQKVKVEEWLGATDDGGAYLEKEILDYMKYGVWDMDFDADTVDKLKEDGQQAEAVKDVAEVYRGHAKDALKLEKALENISESQRTQMDKKQEALLQLHRYDGSGFCRTATELIREFKRMPGLVKTYSKQADVLAQKLGQSRSFFEEKKEDCSSLAERQLETEIYQFEAYVDQDGKRRREIEALEEQSYAQIALVESVIEEALEVERIIREWESDDDEDDGPDLDALWSPVKYHFQQLSIRLLSFSHGVKDKKTENWLKQVESLYNSGLLDLVLPDGKAVSEGILENTELPSGSEICTGRTEEGTLLDHLLINEYCGKFFRYFLIEEEYNQNVGVKGTGGLSYEIEYLIGGKSADEENLVCAVKRLLAIREGLNLLHIMGDGQKRQEAQKLAMAITGVTGFSPLVFLTAFFVMSVWALGESLMDIRGLLAGKQVVIFKKSEHWTLDLEQLLAMGREGRSETGGGEDGLGYLSWLKILLFMDEIVCQEYRMMDMIQMNICRRQSSFRMRRGIYQAKIQGSLVGKHVFFSLGFVERIAGRKDHCYPMEVAIERSY